MTALHVRAVFCRTTPQIRFSCLSFLKRRSFIEPPRERMYGRRLCRLLLRTRGGRRRPCIVAFVFFLVAVALIKNLLIALNGVGRLHGRDAAESAAGDYEIAVVRDAVERRRLPVAVVPQRFPVDEVAAAIASRSTTSSLNSPRTAVSSRRQNVVVDRRTTGESKLFTSDALVNKTIATTPANSTSTAARRSTVYALPPGARVITVDVAQREREFYRRRSTRVNPFGHRVLFGPSGACRRAAGTTTRMMILVHSYHTHGDRRNAIRRTWGSAARTGFWPVSDAGGGAAVGGNGSCAGLDLAFVLGLHRDPGLNDLIREEHDKYDDIVQGDFEDSYQNMTLKSLLGLKFVDERCPGVRYLLKTDDDMVVNLPYLLYLLDAKSPQRSIMGPLNIGSRVYRHGKWKLTREEFPFDVYPPYESGSAYVITGDLIHDLLTTAEYVPPIFVDDVYITGILGRILGVNHVRQKGFAFWSDKAPTACDIVRRRVVTGTKMFATQLTNLWFELTKNPHCVDIQTSSKYITVTS